MGLGEWLGIALFIVVYPSRGGSGARTANDLLFDLLSTSASSFGQMTRCPVAVSKFDFVTTR